MKAGLLVGVKVGVEEGSGEEVADITVGEGGGLVFRTGREVRVALGVL